MQKQLKAVVLVWGYFRRGEKYMLVRRLFEEALQQGLRRQEGLAIGDGGIKVLFPRAFVSDDSIVIEIKLIGVRFEEGVLIARKLRLDLVPATIALKDAGDLCEVPEVNILVSGH